MPNNRRTEWMGNWMRTRAVHGPGSFQRGQRLFAQASAAYRAAHPTAAARTARRNPRGNPVLANPAMGQGDLLKVAAIGLGLYLLAPPVKAAVDGTLGGLLSGLQAAGPPAAPAATTS